MPEALSGVESDGQVPFTVRFVAQPDTDGRKYTEGEQVLAGSLDFGGSILLACMDEQSLAYDGLLHRLQTSDANLADFHEIAGFNVEFDVQDPIGWILVGDRRIHLRERVALILESGCQPLTSSQHIRGDRGCTTFQLERILGSPGHRAVDF